MLALGIVSLSLLAGLVLLLAIRPTYQATGTLKLDSQPSTIIAGGEVSPKHRARC